MDNIEKELPELAEAVQAYSAGKDRNTIEGHVRGLKRRFFPSKCQHEMEEAQRKTEVSAAIAAASSAPGAREAKVFGLPDASASFETVSEYLSNFITQRFVVGNDGMEYLKTQGDVEEAKLVSQRAAHWRLENPDFKDQLNTYQFKIGAAAIRGAIPDSKALDGDPENAN